MRRLASFEDPNRARLFCDALYAEGIETSLRASSQSSHDVWVLDERRLTDARDALEKFESGSSSGEFEEAAKTAREQRRSEADELRTIQRRADSLRAAMGDRAPGMWGAKNPTMSQGINMSYGTLTFIIITVGFAIVTELGKNQEMTMLFTFSDERYPATSGWNAIMSGQVWRLITPAFIHFGPFHIFFNLWWIKDLGTALEHYGRTRTLVALVITTIIVSHLVQVLFVGFGAFGGMSGVVYGLFGYIWIRGRLQPTWALHATKVVVWILLSWLGLGFLLAQSSGVSLQMANGVHTGGLITGMVWGFFASGYFKRFSK